MVVLQPVVKVTFSWKMNWQKPLPIDDEELARAVEKAAREKTPYEEAILVRLRKSIYSAALVYWNPKTKIVGVTLLLPGLVCAVKR